MIQDKLKRAKHKTPKKILPMKISQIAQKVRAAMKRNGVNPNGRVICQQSDYHSEIEVDLRWIDDDARFEIEDVIEELSQDDFAWNCY